MTTENGVNKSETGDWILVYKDLDVIQCSQDVGAHTMTIQTMLAFETEQGCLDYIEDNNLILPIEEELE
jgi:hypothetical protein